MATPVIHELRPSGGDYTSIVTWEATEQRDLVAADETETLECYKGDYSGVGGGANYIAEQFSVGGWTVDATRFAAIRVPLAEQHDGSLPVIPTNVPGFTISSTGTNYLYDDFIQVSGLAMAGGLTSNALIRPSGDTQRLDRLAVNSVGGGIRSQSAKSGLRVYNCLSSAGNGAAYRVQDSPDSVLEHCTAANASTWAFMYGSVVNCVAAAATNAGFASIEAATSSNNASFDTSAPGANPQININPAIEFTDAAGGDYSIGPSAVQLPANGLDRTGVVDDDIIGNPRSVPYDIGAFAVAAAGGFVDLAGSVEGVGDVTGTLEKAAFVALAGSVEGVGTITGTLTALLDLAGSIEGAGDVSGTLEKTSQVNLAGSIEGVGDIAGTLSKIGQVSLAGSVEGVGTVVGNLSKFGVTDLAGSIEGVGTIAGTLTKTGQINLSGSLEGIGLVTGTLSKTTLSLLTVTDPSLVSMTAQRSLRRI